MKKKTALQKKKRRRSFIHVVQSLYFLNPKFQASDHDLCSGIIARFLSVLVRNPKDVFDRDTVQMILKLDLLCVSECSK